MQQNSFYIAAKDTVEKGGIYRCCLDEKNGVRLCSFTPQAATNFLLYSLDKKYLYAGGGEPADDGFISTYLIKADGNLQKKAEFSTQKSNCHLSQAGNFLYAANYMDGSFSEFLIENGIITEETKRIQHHGSGPVKGRQDAAHVHSCNVTPDRHYLAVIDLGSDTISCYPLKKNGVSGVPSHIYHSPSGDGPRHMIFSADGKIAYVINELSNSISSLQYQDGKFTLLKSASTLPCYFRGKATAAAIRFDPEKHFLAITNRGFDSMALFHFSPRGVLKRISLNFIGGIGPRDGNFVSPQCYVVACEKSNEVIFFDYRKGTFSPSGIRLELPHPLYVLPGLPK